MFKYALSTMHEFEKEKEQSHEQVQSCKETAVETKRSEERCDRKRRERNIQRGREGGVRNNNRRRKKTWERRGEIWIKPERGRETDRWGNGGEDDMVGRHGGPETSARPPPIIHSSVLSFLCLNLCPPIRFWLPFSFSVCLEGRGILGHHHLESDFKTW